MVPTLGSQNVTFWYLFRFRLTLRFFDDVSTVVLFTSLSVAPTCAYQTDAGDSSAFKGLHVANCDRPVTLARV